MDAKKTMRRRIALTCTSMLLIESVGAMAAQGNLIPTSWSINVALQRTNVNGFSEQVSDSSHTVQAPFANFSQSAVLGPSLSTAQYAFDIGQTVADYVVNVELECVNHQNGDYVAKPTCTAFGRINLTPSFDVLLTGNLNYDYVLSADPTSASLSFIAGLSSPSELLLSLGDTHNTTLGGPHSGTIAINSASAILPAGRPATIQYIVDVRYFSNSALNLIAGGDASIHLTMTALPEPAALGPLVVAALLIRKRRRVGR